MNRQSTPQRSIFSASHVLEAIASELTTIKHEDGLTDADIGRVLGKSEDQAAKYRSAQTSVLKAALAMSEALEGGDEIVREEVRKNRATLEEARDAIDAQLRKLKPAVQA